MERIEFIWLIAVTKLIFDDNMGLDVVVVNNNCKKQENAKQNKTKQENVIGLVSP